MLSENLFIVLITDLTSNKFCEYVLPLITVQEIWRVFTCNCYEKPKHESKLLGQFKREPYDFQGRLTDYTSLFVIFGYLVMFSPALPIASLLVAMSTAWESRGDLMKLFHMFRRVQGRLVRRGRGRRSKDPQVRVRGAPRVALLVPAPVLCREVHAAQRQVQSTHL